MAKNSQKPTTQSKQGNQISRLNIEDFKNQIHFIEILLLVSTLLIVVVDRIASVANANVLFVFFVILAIFYYFIVEFELYNHKALFLLLTAFTALSFAGTLALALGLSVLFSYGLILTFVVAIAYLIIMSVLVFLILAKPLKPLIKGK